MDPIWVSGTQRHRGLDIRSACGTPIVAAAPGEVIFAQLTRGSGNTVRILHPGGMLTRYAHLSRLDVRPGEQVRAGQRIGLSGATGRTTGPHLHFEIWRNSKPENPLRYKFKYLPAAAFAGGDPFIDCYSRNNYRAPTEPEPLHEPGEMEWPGEEETSNLLQEYDRFIHTY
jgi:hypothetical protein